MFPHRTEEAQTRTSLCKCSAWTMCIESCTTLNTSRQAVDLAPWAVSCVSFRETKCLRWTCDGGFTLSSRSSAAKTFSGQICLCWTDQRRHHVAFTDHLFFTPLVGVLKSWKKWLLQIKQQFNNNIFILVSGCLRRLLKLSSILSSCKYFRDSVNVHKHKIANEPFLYKKKTWQIHQTNVFAAKLFKRCFHYFVHLCIDSRCC